MTIARVLYVDHAESVGGAERSLLLLLKHLNRDRIQPLLACSAGPLAEQAAAIGVPIHPVPMPRLRGQAGAPLDLWRGARVLVDVVRREKVAIVHSNVMRASFYGALACRLTHCSFVWHVRDIHARGWYVRMMKKLADRTIAISRAVALPIGDSHAAVIYNGLDLHEFDPSSIDGVAFREELGVTGDTLLVGVVGRVRPWKGQRSFLEAASQVAERVSGVHFLVVGDTIFPAKEDYVGELKRFAQDQGIAGSVTFTGHRSDVAQILAALDLLVHCSEAEPFGRVLIEAMAMAKPVVAFADGGVPEVVVDGETGLLVPPGDVAALAWRIEDLLCDESLRRAMGQKGRARVEAMFTAEQMTRKVENLYEELLSSRGAGSPEGKR
jgi:glycosyltransferase involved in cell wall biosynthesis